jgi:fatty acid synthase subunit beta
LLIGKYIPNLIAKPFDVSRDYAQLLYDQTSSPRLDKALRQWDQEKWAGAAQRQKLAYIILVELYQFASPVHWIDTQDNLFMKFNFEHFIEVGPCPTLTGMVTRTLRAKYDPGDDSINHARSILCHAKNAKKIYYRCEDEVEAPPVTESASEVTVAAAVSPVPAAITAAPSPATAATSIEDVPIKAVDVLLVVIAQKLKKKVDEVLLSKSIQELVGGKSTLQHEILGDLQLELSSAPEKGEELPLQELGSALSARFSKAKAWLDSLYAQHSGINLSAGFSSAGDATINSKEFLKFQAEQEKFAAQNIELYMHYLKRDSRSGKILFDKEKANFAALQAKLDSIAKEHGDTYVDGIQSIFDPLKAQHFDSSWNWARQDAQLTYSDVIFGRLTTVDRDISARAISLLNRADAPLLTYMQYNIDHCDETRGEKYKLAKEFGQQLIDNTREVMDKPSIYKDGEYQVDPFRSSFLILSQRHSPLLHTPRSPQRVISSILRLSEKMSTNWKPTSKKWPAVTRSLAASSPRRSKTAFLSYGRLSVRSLVSAWSKRVASRHSTRASFVRYVKLQKPAVR